MSRDPTSHFDDADRRKPNGLAVAGHDGRVPQRRKIDCAGNAEITDRRYQVRGGRDAALRDHQ